MKRVFITHILPKDSVLKYNLSVAGCNFSWNLIEGNVFDQFYSIMPLYVRDTQDDIDMKELVFSRLRINGRFFSIIAIILENWHVFKKLPKDSNVWLYNISSLNLLLFFFLKFFRRKTKIYAIILDYTPSCDLLSRLNLWALNHCDGTISLSKSSLFKVKNTICLPGVTPNMINNIPLQKEINREFLISGALNERISMLPMLLSVFSRIPELTLHVTGFGANLQLMEQYKRYTNIHFHGEVSYDDYLKIFHQASFLLSTRNPDCPENQCNFPSKVMEALLHNRIVITTIDYEQLKGLKYLKVSGSDILFEKELRQICHMDESILLEYANQSDKTIRLFNTNKWKESMSEIENNTI